MTTESEKINEKVEIKTEKTFTIKFGDIEVNLPLNSLETIYEKEVNAKNETDFLQVGQYRFNFNKINLKYYVKTETLEVTFWRYYKEGTECTVVFRNFNSDEKYKIDANSNIDISISQEDFEKILKRVVEKYYS